ncbi:MAG: response regulator transcription factor [Chloroflexales bacterium]|jgi:two-component system, NarL family, response regulator LiaR
MIRVLIVDDHAVVRRGLQSMLELEADIQVVGDAESGVSAVEKARTLSPGIVLLDLKMPGMGGALACRAIKAISPHSRVLILTGVDAEQEVMTALEHGADGYVLKDAPADELLHAIRVIASGQAYLQPSITRRVLRRLSANNAPQPPLLPPQLTPRELDVLRLMATSRSNKEMADSLTVTEETVRSHIKSILGKLRQPNRMQAVLAALRLGIITLE